jgi:predicted TIM-barrel fold metal-dependent hydrolase
MGVYALCEERGLPVTAHCSPSGIWRYGLSARDRARLSHPRNYEAVLARFPKLRLCLAHFGGAAEWDRSLRGRTARDLDDRPWVQWIVDLIRSGTYPNLYTDTSYLIFQSPGRQVHVTYMDYLKVLLADPRVREHVLFGSDYYMVEREPFTEKEVSIGLRSHLGEELYFQIANVNPRRFLGLETPAGG